MNRSSSKGSLEEWYMLVDESIDRSAQEGLLLTDLLDRADMYGVDRERAREYLFASCADPATQAVWDDWEDVRDREELRLRLECLRYVEELHPSLHEFILFFFRASDPVLYQAAALALGVHLEQHPPLQRYFTSFADRRGIPLNRPIQLDGERSRRRVLLGLTGRAAAAKYQNSDAWSYPLALDDPDLYLTQDAADVSTCLVAAEVLLTSEYAPSNLEAFSQDIVYEVAHRSDLVVSRVLIRNWGRVLVSLSSVSAQWRKDVWLSFLRRLSVSYEEETSGVGPLVERFHEMDEVIRTAAFLPLDLQRRLLQSVTAHLERDTSAFVLVRLRRWLERESKASELVPLEELPEEPVSEILRQVVRVEGGGSREVGTRLDEGGGESRRRTLFAEWLALLYEPKRWLIQPVEKRALIAFFLLDFSLYLRMTCEESERLFGALGVDPARETFESSPLQLAGGRGHVTVLTFRVLTQLLSVESSGAELLVDPDWIYQTTDSVLLRQLLPSGQKPERLRPLADAFEHHMRFRMASDPDFAPEHFLYLTAVRKPHPEFYDQLLRTCRDRVYQTEEGRTIPVKEIVHMYAREARTVAQDRDRTHSVLEDRSTITGDELLPGETVFANELCRLRGSLISLVTEEDLFSALARLTDTLNPRTKDPRWGSKGLIDFIGRVNVQERGVLESDGLWGSMQPYERFAASIQEQAVRLEEEITDLVPDTLQEISAARDAALSVRRILSDVAAAVTHVAGAVEALLVDHAITILRGRVVDWVTTLEKLHDTWIRQNGDAPRYRKEIWKQLVEEIGGLQNSGVRHQAFSLYYRSLLEFSRRGFEGIPRDGRTQHGERDEWIREYTVLQWGMTLLQEDSQLSPDDRELWAGFMVDSWNRLMEEAMKNDHESRVVRLIHEPGHRPILKHPRTRDTLENVQTWLFDRYRTRSVTSLERRVSPTGASWASLQTYGAFILHFSHVWLALLVGAMLLLDFGDAWTAMAAAGDVTGIVLTSLLGIGGTFLYLLTDLIKKTRHAPEDNLWRHRLSRVVRAILFLLLCLVFAFGLTTLLWFLLSGTDVVVHGEYAVYHIVVWTGFALFVGVFFGLLAQST